MKQLRHIPEDVILVMLSFLSSRRFTSDQTSLHDFFARQKEENPALLDGFTFIQGGISNYSQGLNTTFDTMRGFYRIELEKPNGQNFCLTPYGLKRGQDLSVTFTPEELGQLKKMAGIFGTECAAQTLAA